MTYKEYVLEVLRDHHDCMGADMEELEDTIKDVPFSHIEKWLTKIGYDLNEFYL